MRQVSTNIINDISLLFCQYRGKLCITMAAFIKRGGPKRFGPPRGKSSFGSARGGKPSFAKKSWGESRSDDAPSERFKATCSKCGDTCEVPFRPTSGKPVFCRNCFVRTGETAAGRAGDRFPRREIPSRDSRSPLRQAASSNTDVEVLKQLEMLNAKLERLIQGVEALAASSKKQ